ncbi:MAG: rRNA maturation RNase YbeY [Bacilli bacterium]
MEINVFNQYGNIIFDYEKIIRDIEKEFPDPSEVSLILVNREEISSINATYRHLDKETDVISFEDEEEGYLGDIFICIDKVIEQAKAYDHSNEREFAFLLVHGLLHLTGYDHLNATDEQIMFAKQEEILARTAYVRINNIKEKI